MSKEECEMHYYHMGDGHCTCPPVARTTETSTYETSEDHERCERCKGRGFYGYTVPGNEGVPEYDVDDQPCPDCNPDGDSRNAP